MIDPFIYNLPSPAAPFLARPHGADLPNSKWGVFEHTYANFQPLFQLSTGSFPSGLFQDPSIDLPLRDFTPRSDLDKVVQALCKWKQTSFCLGLTLWHLIKILIQKNGEVHLSDFSL